MYFRCELYEGDYLAVRGGKVIVKESDRVISTPCSDVLAAINEFVADHHNDGEYDFVHFEHGNVVIWVTSTKEYEKIIMLTTQHEDADKRGHLYSSVYITTEKIKKIQELLKKQL